MQTQDELSQFLPTPLVFISGYANTENVSFFLNRISQHYFSKDQGQGIFPLVIPNSHNLCLENNIDVGHS